MKKLYFDKLQDEFIYCLIIYDISDDKRRTKFAKALEGFGKRVQMSAFEFWISKNEFKRLSEKIDKIAKKEDNIRVYYLNKADYNKNPHTSILGDEIRCDVYIS